MVTPQKEETVEKEGPETPLLDLSDAAVKELIGSAKRRGYVTHDQINALPPSEQIKSERIEGLLARLSELGVNVIETNETELEEEEVAAREEPQDEAEGEQELVEVQKRPAPTKSGPKNPSSASTIPRACIFAKWVR